MPLDNASFAKRRRAALLTAAGFAAAAGLPPALAQTDPASLPGSEAAAGGGTQVFEPTYFSVYNPISAADMVRQVPGFAIDDGDNARGFGATAGNVLINGERPSTKSGVSEELARIPATNVARIELIRGGASEADIRGRATLVNVVLRDIDGAEPTTTYVAQIHATEAWRLGLYGELSRSFRFAGADVNLSVQPYWTPRRFDYEERLYEPDGEVLELRDDYNQTNYRELSFTGSARWRPTARDAFGLNVSFNPSLGNEREVSLVTDESGDLLRTDTFEVEERDAYEREIGADWEHRLTPQLSVKLVGLDAYGEWLAVQEFTSRPVSGAAETTFITRPTELGERIGRLSATWRASDRHTVEVGAEGAFNFRETDLDIAVDSGAGPVPVDLPVSDTRVEELRGELFVTDVWTVSPRLSLESGFTFEASRITQTGDAEQEREFTYPKPRLIATYAVTENDQLRLSLVRDVAQLDFSEFASAIAVNDDIVTVGNPDLEPERTWRLRGEWERRYGERGAFTLAAYHHRVESVQDLVVLGDFTGPGNLGDGGRLGASLQSSTPLDALGLTNAVLRFNTTLQNTWVEDPLTGVERDFAFENDWSYYFEFRQDVPSRRFAWGWDYASGSEYYAFRVNELQVRDGGEGDFDMFVETSRWGGVTTRLGVDNIFDQTRTTERFIFDGSRASGIVDRIDLQDSTAGPFVYLRISGAF